jgi:NADPH2:quinone reductase
MICVTYTGVGGREVVDVRERPDPVPSKYEVVLAPAFAGVNPADVLQREGRHPIPPGAPKDVPGLEVAGIVVARGEAVTAFSVGDRAFGLVGGGGLANRVVAHERELVPVPETISDREAAAIPEAFITAFDAICVQGGLGPGDTLLVNGANGGVGTAAVQIAAAMGVTVVAGVRSSSTAQQVGELNATALLQADAFAHVRELGGADVVLELVGAPHMTENLRAIARRGRIVIVGSRPGDEATIGMRELMSVRGSVIGTTLRTRHPEEKAALIQDFGRRVVPRLRDRSAHAIVDRVFALRDAADALDYVRSPGKFGKVLLDTSGDAGLPR